jgi:hypothetical protein
VRIITPSITACPPTIRSLSLVLNVFYPFETAPNCRRFDRCDLSQLYALKRLLAMIAASDRRNPKR